MCISIRPKLDKKKYKTKISEKNNGPRRNMRGNKRHNFKLISYCFSPYLIKIVLRWSG